MIAVIRSEEFEEKKRAPGYGLLSREEVQDYYSKSRERAGQLFKKMLDRGKREAL